MAAMRPTRRAVLRGLGASLVAGSLAACATPDPYRPRSTGGATRGGGPSQVPGQSRTVTVGGVDHLVPVRASRIVTLGDDVLQPVLDLDGPVVATAAIAAATVPPARQDVVRGLDTLGRGRDGDVVTPADVLEHAPDLVLAGDGTSPALVAEVGERVPIVVVPLTGEGSLPWPERVATIAEVIGVGVGDLEPRLTAHEQDVARRHAATLASARVVVLRAWDTEHLTAYGPTSPIGRLYAGAGVRFVDAVDGRDRVDDTLANVLTYLEGADLAMMASDYAGGLDAFTGGSLANSDPVTGHPALVRGAGVLRLTSYAQAHDLLERLSAALTDLESGLTR